THDEPCSMAPDDKHDLISGTCSHLPKLAAADEAFIKLGAHGVVRHGDSIQVIIGLHVPQVRENMESIMNNSHQQSSLVMES
ncbi:hypothetical protein ACK35F_17080, partial [Aeromonas veronii]